MLRNLYFRRALLESASIAYKFEAEDGEALAEHGQKLCSAAAELYHHLESGHYTTVGGKKRNINGDIAKLRLAKDLSAEARALERNLWYVSSQVSLGDFRHTLIFFHRSD